MAVYHRWSETGTFR